jgi:hypothetical protein
MVKLIHPGTQFLNSLTYEVKALQDMTPQQQFAIWRYMHADGDGIWGNYPTVDAAVAKLGDVKFRYGSFANDKAMKLAFVSCLPAEMEVDTDDIIGYFNGRFVGHYCEADPIPVFLGNPNSCGDTGLLDDGHTEFYDHWVKQPRTEFVAVMPDWTKADDERGGQ